MTALRNPIVVCGVDPGKTVGLFVAKFSFVVAVGGPRLRDGRGVRCDVAATELGVDDFYLNFDMLCLVHPRMMVACESYVVTERTARLTQQSTALEVIGVVKQLCRDRDVPLEIQAKSNVARFARNDLLKRLDWHTPGKDHANDAARHALWRLAVQYPTIFQALEKSGRIGQPHQ